MVKKMLKKKVKKQALPAVDEERAIEEVAPIAVSEPSMEEPKASADSEPSTVQPEVTATLRPTSEQTPLSPYARNPIAIHVGPAPVTYYVPWHLLQSTIWSTVLPGGTISLPMTSAETGHILVHYLYTGTYRPLESEVNDIAQQPQLALKQALRVHRMLVAHTLDGLEQLTRQHIEEHSASMDLKTILDIIRGEWPQETELSGWLQAYLKEKTQEAFEKDHTVFADDAFCASLRETSKLNDYVMCHMVKLLSEKLTQALAGNGHNTDELDEIVRPQPVLEEVVADEDPYAGLSKGQKKKKINEEKERAEREEMGLAEREEQERLEREREEHERWEKECEEKERLVREEQERIERGAKDAKEEGESDGGWGAIWSSMKKKESIKEKKMRERKEKREREEKEKAQLEEKEAEAAVLAQYGYFGGDPTPAPDVSEELYGDCKPEACCEAPTAEVDEALDACCEAAAPECDEVPEPCCEVTAPECEEAPEPCCEATAAELDEATAACCEDTPAEVDEALEACWGAPSLESDEAPEPCCEATTSDPQFETYSEVSIPAQESELCYEGSIEAVHIEEPMKIEEPTKIEEPMPPTISSLCPEGAVHIMEGDLWKTCETCRTRLREILSQIV